MKGSGRRESKTPRSSISFSPREFGSSRKQAVKNAPENVAACENLDVACWLSHEGAVDFEQNIAVVVVEVLAVEIVVESLGGPSWRWRWRRLEQGLFGHPPGAGRGQVRRGHRKSMYEEEKGGRDGEEAGRVKNNPGEER